MLIEQVAAISYIPELGIMANGSTSARRSKRLFGYSAEEWLFEFERLDTSHPLSKITHHSCRGRSLRRGEPPGEYRVTAKTGRPCGSATPAVVVRGSDSHPVMEGLIVDITDRKLLENQLLQAGKMEAVGRLAGRRRTRFNNLLRSSRVTSRWPCSAAWTGRSCTRYPAHRKCCRSRGHAVRQLLAFSRKQVLQPKIPRSQRHRGESRPAPAAVDDENIEIKTFVSKDVGAIKADPGQIEQVI